MKKLLLTLGTVAAIAAPVASVVSCGNTVNTLEWSNEESNLIKATQAADINLFYNGDGVATSTYMMRLALLANTEVHYGLLSEKQGKTNQDKVNKKEFQRFLKTRVINPTNTTKECFPNSEVFSVGKDKSGTIAINKWLKIIKNNPTKKINVFWNSDHLNHENGSKITPMDLQKFSNVHLILLEDGGVISSLIKPTKEYVQNLLKQTGPIKPINQSYYFDQNIIPERYGIYSYFSSKINVKRLNDLGLKHFEYLDPKSLFENIFNNRDKNNVRLMAEWPKATGLDWHDAKNTLDEVSKNGKPSMIILGTAHQDESKFLEEIYKKYSSTYNLFYKGHPGYYEWNNFVEKNMHGKINLLDPMISSEELTREHADEGMYFNKVVCVGETSAIVGGFKNGHNDITKDLLAVFKNGHIIFNDGTGNNFETALNPGFWQSVINAK